MLDGLDGWIGGVGLKRGQKQFIVVKMHLAECDVSHLLKRLVPFVTSQTADFLNKFSEKWEAEK